MRWTAASANPPEPPLSGQLGRLLREGVFALPRGRGEVGRVPPPEPGTPSQLCRETHREWLGASSSVTPHPARLHQALGTPWGLSPHLVTPKTAER